MLREEKLAGHLAGLRYAPLKEQTPGLEIIFARGVKIQVRAKSQAQVSTAAVPSVRARTGGCRGMGISSPSASMASSSGGFACGSADAAPARDSVCASAVGLEWEVKLQEKSRLLCCAEIRRKIGFPLATAARADALFAHMRPFGQPCCNVEAGEVSP